MRTSTGEAISDMGEGKKDVLQVDSNTRIVVEDGNYCIQKKKSSKEGKERWVTDSYFRDIGDVAQELLMILPMASTELRNDLGSIVRVVKKAKADIEKVVDRAAVKKERKLIESRNTKTD